MTYWYMCEKNLHRFKVIEIARPHKSPTKATAWQGRFISPLMNHGLSNPGSLILIWIMDTDLDHP